MQLARKHQVKILPVGLRAFRPYSRSLQGSSKEEVSKIILTASGGPFQGKRQVISADCDEGDGIEASQLGHGRENHHRLIHHDDQRAGRSLKPDGSLM